MNNKVIVKDNTTSSTEYKTSAYFEPEDPKDKSIELQFSEYVLQYSSNGSLLGKLTEIICEWNGSHWITVENKEYRKLALSFLSKHFKSRVTDRSITSCVTVLKEHLPELGEQEQNIIPLINCVINIQDKKFSICKPIKQNYNLYAINAVLPDVKYGAEYKPVAKLEGTLFKQFLDSSLPDVAVQNVLQEFAGTTIATTLDHQKALILIGDGRNGKGVFTKILSALHQKAVPFAINQLDDNSLLDLVDCSLALVNEIPNSLLASEKLKELIACDPIRVKRLYQDRFKIKPFAKWILSTNSAPIFGEHNAAISERFINIPFEHTVEASKRVINLAEKIIDTELDVVFEWAMEGLQRFLNNECKFSKAAACESMSEELQYETNSVFAFFQDNQYKYTYQDKANRDLTRDELYKLYAVYCDMSGRKAISRIKFEKQVKSQFKLCKIIRTSKENKKIECWNLTRYDLKDYTDLQ